MFSDLMITRDKTTNAFVGGGYTLNSSFLNARIPPIVQAAGKGQRSRSRSRSRSRDSSDAVVGVGVGVGVGVDANDADAMKVSSLLERNAGSSDALVIPAGLFMIHADIALKTDDNTNAVTNKDERLAKNIERFLYDGPEVAESSSDANDVVPSDLYERLFSMLSPSQSDAKQYWHPRAATRSNRGKRKAGVVVAGSGNGKSKATRRINQKTPKQ